MSITDFGRQLRPREYKSVNHLEKINEIVLLKEATTASTVFEGVIAACHNGDKNEQKFKKQILKDRYVKDFLRVVDKKWAVYGKSEEEQLDILWNFSKICKKQLSGSSDAGAGQSKMKVSGSWKDITGKKVDTSKADISVGGYATSVKGPLAQLMSGKKLEVKATLLAALEMSGSGQKLKNELIAEVEKFVDNTRTIGAEVSAGVLKKMSVDDAKKTGNEEAKKIVDTQEEMKRDITKKFEAAFKKPDIGNAFAKESMMGYEKFGGYAFPNQPAGDSNGLATHMLIWDYRMDRLKFLKIDDKFIAATASKMKVKPDIKSGSYKAAGVKQGYSFYQALRVSVKVLLDKTGEIEESYMNEIQHNKNLLTEGQLNEVSFKKAVDKVISWVRNKIKALWEWFSTRVATIANKIIELINEGIDKALHIFEVDVDATVNTTVKL